MAEDRRGTKRDVPRGVPAPVAAEVTREAGLEQGLGSDPRVEPDFPCVGDREGHGRGDRERRAMSRAAQPGRGSGPDNAGDRLNTPLSMPHAVPLNLLKDSLISLVR